MGIKQCSKYPKKYRNISNKGLLILLFMRTKENQKHARKDFTCNVW